MKMAMARVKGVMKGLGIFTAATVGVAGAGGTYAYNTNAGFQRETKFWGEVGPIILHYAWAKRTTPDIQERNKKFKELHSKYSGNVLDLFTSLGGLFIKTGQYLSVRPEIVPLEYRSKFKALQSEVPGREFEDIRSVIEMELGDLDLVFSEFDHEHLGAASIGQAHRAKTIDGEDVVVKVMYPDVEWKFIVDLKCIRDVIDIGVFFDVIDGASVQSNFNEFETQYLSELDYEQEVKNLNEIRASVEDAYAGKVAFPRPFPELSSKHVITMTLLKGPKLEEEMQRRLSRFGISSATDLRSILSARAAPSESHSNARTVDDAINSQISQTDDAPTDTTPPSTSQSTATSLLAPTGTVHSSKTGSIGSYVGYYAVAVLGTARTLGLMRNLEWAYTSVASRLGYIDVGKKLEFEGTELQLINTLLDVHGFEIFQTELFNADPHPGNIILMENDQLGLIDYGQCKRLSKESKKNIAACIVAVAEKQSDEDIADAFRSAGFKSRNDDASFFASFGQLMFGHIEVEMLDPKWHKELRSRDSLLKFPADMIMVYRVAALLRGLSLSLQYDVSISEAWCVHAKQALLE